MGDVRTLSRLSLRTDQVIEFHWAPLPEPPAEFLKLPGARAWFEQLKIMRERDIQSLHRFVLRYESSTTNPVTPLP
jgi:hypothetical protein